MCSYYYYLATLATVDVLQLEARDSFPKCLHEHFLDDCLVVFVLTGHTEPLFVAWFHHRVATEVNVLQGVFDLCLQKEKEKRLSYEADVAVLAHELIQFEREAWITEACLG